MTDSHPLADIINGMTVCTVPDGTVIVDDETDEVLAVIEGGVGAIHQGVFYCTQETFDRITEEMADTMEFQKVTVQ